MAIPSLFPSQVSFTLQHIFVQIKKKCLLKNKEKKLLELELQQVAHHLPRRHTGSGPQSWEIQRARECVGIAKEQHGRDPTTGVLEREARAVHLVLLDLATNQVVYGTSGVALGLKATGDVGELFTREDVEVVVCGVAAGVALGADGGTEDDEILGDA